MIITVPTEAYDNKRFSLPWIARVTDWESGKGPRVRFGKYSGKDGDPGKIIIDAEIGDVIKIGQKDYTGEATKNDYYIVGEHEEISQISEEAALEHYIETWTDKKEVERPLEQYTTEELLVELIRRNNV